MQQIFGDAAKHITQSFNALSQRTQIARYQSTGATNLNTYAYTYDPLSRIATIVSTLEGTDTYSYDQTSQVTGATHTSHSNESYGFDANGNRNTSGFTTGTNNQTTAGLGFTFVYDDEGNRTSKTETSTGKVEEYTWDHRNRLTKVVFRNSSGGAIVKQVDYEYDSYNRLVRRTFDADGAGAGAATNQYWVYDEGINAVLQFDGSSASNLSHRYLWSDNVDELLADEQIAGNNTLWGLADHLGSLRDIADYSESTGVTTIANHRTLNSFGKLVSETNAAVDMLFAFTGKQFDEATGLQHNLFRWLDPSLGQWLNEDPIGFAAGDENVRRYVGNRVTSSVDKYGLDEHVWVPVTYQYYNVTYEARMTRVQVGWDWGGGAVFVDRVVWIPVFSPVIIQTYELRVIPSPSYTLPHSVPQTAPPVGVYPPSIQPGTQLPSTQPQNISPPMVPLPLPSPPNGGHPLPNRVPRSLWPFTR
ncbi:MAG: hypothetical protein KGQ60_01900 [Planctomycetes bacterium]|nr:hypothetical protein [Planctomycetota bacterium]